jgi:hypothetical protein
LKERYIFQIEKIENLSGEQVDVAPGSGHRVRIALPEKLNANLEYGLLVRHLTEPESDVIRARRKEAALADRK